MINDYFVIDAVTHAYNHLPQNWADAAYAEALSETAFNVGANPPDGRYALNRDVYLSDWQVPDLANVLFRESNTDVAVMHPVAITAY